MKKLILSLAVLASTPSAFAMHAYGFYDCKGKNIQLRYDGPGSNYAFGGFSNFYSSKNEKFLSYEPIDEGDKVEIGDEIGGGSIGVVFSVVDSRVVGEVKEEIPDANTCKRGAYEHSEWKSEKSIHIDEISSAAAAALGLKKGQVVEVSCEETRDVPADCKD